jgi:acetyl-CoA acyltransferase
MATTTREQVVGGGDRVAIVAGVRTPFVKAWSEFRDYNEVELSRTTLNELIHRVDVDPADIGEVVMGCVSAPMNGPNVAREAILRSQIPNHVPGYSVQMYCASSGQAVINAAGDILMGACDVAIAGGVESMSSAQARISLSLSQALNDASKARRLPDRLKAFSDVKFEDLKPDVPSIAEPTTGRSMGESAEDMAKEYGISREEQDRYAEMSHHRADRAHTEGRFKEVFTYLSGPDFSVPVERDTMVRGDTTLEKMAKLRPVFDRDHGTITAANASPLTDGASALMLMRESRARAMGVEPIAYIRSHSIVGLDLFKYGLLLGPTFATPIALQRAGVELGDIDLIEMHEAFAAQVLCNIKIWESKKLSEELGLERAIGEVDYDRFNVHGGSIPIGHPFGATGARLVMQLAYEMQRRDVNLGLLTACAAGGLGLSMVLER